MLELHGITEKSEWAIALLKQQALLFDKWYVVPPEKSLAWKDEGLSPNCVADLEFLMQRGIVEDVSPDIIKQCRQADVPGLESSIAKMALRDTARMLKIASEKWGGGKPFDLDRLPPDMTFVFSAMADGKKNQFVTDLLIRRVAMRLAQRSDADISPHYQIAPYVFKDVNSKAQTVLRVALKELPVPSRAASWQDVLDFRSELHDKRWGFRRFLRSLATKSQREAEIRDEIEWTLNEYKKSMEVHKVKATYSFVDIYVFPIIELVEDVVKFNWSKIAKGVLSVTKRNAELLEAEMKAPGRECAYLFNARNVFGDSEEEGIFQLLEQDTREAIAESLTIPDGYYDDLIEESLNAFVKTEFGTKREDKNG